MLNHDQVSPEVCSIAAKVSWAGGTLRRMIVITRRPLKRMEPGASTVPLPANPLGVNPARVGASTANVNTYVPTPVAP